MPKCFAARDGFGEFSIAGLFIYHAQRGKTTTANLRARLTDLSGKFPRRDFAIDFTKSSETIRVVSKSQIWQLLRSKRWQKMLLHEHAKSVLVAQVREPRILFKPERVRVCSCGKKRVARLQERR